MPDLTLALVAASSALLGSLIGGLASLLGTYINTRHEAHRKHVELVVQAAVADQQHTLTAFTGTRAAIPPLSSYVVYYDSLLTLIENGDALTPQALNEINKRVQVVVDIAKPPHEY